MLRRGRLYVATLAAIIVSAAYAGEVPAPTALIHAGHLLDRPGSQPRSSATVLVRDGRIAEVRDGFVDPQDFPGAHVIDMRAYFVLPGLIDSHVHFNGTESGKGALLERLSKDTAFFAYQAATLARLTLDAGFTTVRVLGNPAGVTLSLRDAIAAGALPGPRILDAGNSIAATGGSGDVTLGVHSALAGHMDQDNLCDGTESCRRAVRLQVRRGVDLIKLKITGGVNSRVATGLGRQMFIDEARAVVETAHLYGKKVAVHAHGADGINLALECGADSIEHGTLLDDQGIELMLRSGAFLVPTLSTATTYVERLANNPGTYTQEVREKMEWRASVTGQALRQAYARGVRIAFGTDAGVSPHGRNAEEFVLMVKYGMTPGDAIKAATLNAAELLGIADEVGSLEPGKRADLVAVRGNPLEDIAVLQHVPFVMKGGLIWKQ